MISVIIPVYNVEKHVTRTLNSLANQTDNNFELVIVNDGSIDSTLQVITEYIAQNKLHNVKIINQENAGVSVARNTGIEASTGEYVYFLDGDDYVEIKLIETLNNVIKDEHPDLVFWKWRKVTEQGELINDYHSILPYDNTLMMNGEETLKKLVLDKSIRMISAISGLYNRKQLNDHNIRYTPCCVNGEDQEFAFKALSVADKVVSLQDVYSYYVQRKGSLTNNYNIKKFDFADALKRAGYFMLGKNPNLKEVAMTLLKGEMIDNYFYNLSSCLQSAKSIYIRKLLKDIEIQYPGTTKEMKELMRTWKREKQSKNRLVDAYLIAPELFHALLIIRNMKSKVKSVVGI
ncbi:glycosyltransferase family 2 protein [Paenibacillus spiritus]|uniref:glycosyltransferase family 2 protein n=1 Tax=Paenibacillus spiritus TaxID=2496557 RepID=UPI00168AEB5A|nr:glycosyltransferase family A protein [Paenibacillus spiritus]